MKDACLEPPCRVLYNRYMPAIMLISPELPAIMSPIALPISPVPDFCTAKAGVMKWLSVFFLSFSVVTTVAMRGYDGHLTNTAFRDTGKQPANILPAHGAKLETESHSEKGSLFLLNPRLFLYPVKWRKNSFVKRDWLGNGNSAFFFCLQSHPIQDWGNSFFSVNHSSKLCFSVISLDSELYRF